jgi:hypothetical protein
MQRMLLSLSLLLLHANQPLSGDWLVEALWGGRSDGRSTGRSPSSGTGGHRLRTHVWALRIRSEARRGAGDAAAAAADQERALALVRGVGYRKGEREVLWRLGLAQRDLEERRRGDTSWRHALVIFQQLGAPQAADVRRLLDDPGCERP